MADTVFTYPALRRAAAGPGSALPDYNWHGFASSEQFRELLGRGLPLHQTEAHRTQPLERLAAGWNLRACQAGIRHVGFVVPESVIG